jgi:hypothetical protein
MRALLDINVLLALFDEAHVHHATARDWLLAHRADGWASCPVTQNGFLRIVSQPAYPNRVPLSAAILMLREAVADQAHQFWLDSVSAVDASTIAHDRLHGHRQLTDTYLLALAVANGGRLVTLDAGIPLAAVPRARKADLVVL